MTSATCAAPKRCPAADGQRPEATGDQAAVIAALEAAVGEKGFRPFLLHGITGSGKTEVYFRAAERALEAGRTVLILVPEIALTHMLVRAAVARFGPTVAVQHSELSVGERHDQWWRIREAEARVVVGARSAVFAPLPSLGLVIVDEEHEASYKQEDSPRYHGRDVAVMRARLEGATVVLGTATPSLESFRNAERGKYTLLAPAAAHLGPRPPEGRDRGSPGRAQGRRRRHPEPAAAARPWPCASNGKSRRCFCSTAAAGPRASCAASAGSSRRAPTAR